MIACLTVPYFSAAVERRDSQDLAETPLVIGGQPWEARPVYAFSQEAAQGGVRPGMSLRLAHVLTPPHSRFMPANPLRYLDVSGEVVDVLADFSPFVEPEELWQPEMSSIQHTAGGQCLPARYYLDLECLPLAEALPLVQEMGRTVRVQTSLAPAIGLAERKVVAQIAATVTRPNHAKVVEPEEESQFLADRPIHFLPLDKEAGRRLRLLGIHTIGQLAALPPTAVQEQFGSGVAALQRLVKGDPGAAGVVQPQRPEQVEQVTCHFESSVVNLQTLEVILDRAANALANRLQKTGLAGQRLALAWQLEDGSFLEQCLVLRRPTTQRETLAAACQELLSQASFPTGVIELAVTLTDLAPAAAQQLTLFASSPAAHQAEQTLRHVMTKHGRCLYRPVLLDNLHPLPERRFQWQEFQSA